METTLSILFGISSLINAGALAVSILLSPKPQSTSDHVCGVGRLMVFTGALCNWAANQTNNYVPDWHGVMFSVGIALLTLLYAKNHWFLAKQRELTQ